MTAVEAMDDGDVLIRVQSWWSSRLGTPVTLTLEDRLASGFSADNNKLLATVDGQTSRHVLRRDGHDGSPYPEQGAGLGNGVSLQASVMRALDGVVPVATGVVVEPDPDVLGTPFLVMDFIDGVVPIEHPPCTREGFFATASPAFRTTMITTGLEALARVHTTPWRDRLPHLHEEWQTPGARRQLHLWKPLLANGLGERSDGIFERATDALHAHLPADPAPSDVVLLWGDARLGNIIWDPISGTPSCLTDFEGAAVGERELDLGWWLLADRWMHEESGVERLDGEPTRAEQVTIYEAAARVRVADLWWYELFAGYRFAAAAVAVMNRYERSGVMPAGHPFWRDNPATSLMARILDDTATKRP